MAKSQKLRVIRVDSWDELPEVLEPGTYEVGGERFEIYEPVERDVWREVIRGIRELHREYYG